MDLNKAWITLGRDPEDVFRELAAPTSLADRLRAVEKSLQDAERTAKVLLARYHPDANPNDPDCVKRFMAVKDAIGTIRQQTEEFKGKLGRSPDAASAASGHVVIKV